MAILQVNGGGNTPQSQESSIHTEKLTFESAPDASPEMTDTVATSGDTASIDLLNLGRGLYDGDAFGIV